MASTIYAVATGPGRAGVAIIRVSGRDAAKSVLSLCGRLPDARRATLLTLREPENGLEIDKALVLWFPAPASFTGEDCVEFHLHGSTAVIAKMHLVLSLLPDFRMAEAGEFTRRAFVHGRIDLSQAEGLADLIDSETEEQRKQAIRQLSGLLGVNTTRWRSMLIQAVALMEAEIDFVDEEDAPAKSLPMVREIVSQAIFEINAMVAASANAERLKQGLVVVIAGPPNVGKSTLLNTLAMREAAIVSPQAGTTRDPVWVQLNVEGFPVHLVDTAGMRKGRGKVETIGIARARELAQQADLIFWLNRHGDRKQSLEHIPTGVPVWNIMSKSDLSPRPMSLGRSISCKDGTGIEALIADLGNFAARTLGSHSGSVVTKERHRIALSDTLISLRALQDLDEDCPIEIYAEYIRQAMYSIASITGKIGVEDILGEIFSRFCIGK